MPNNSAHSPEALLGRNDSKNPATTCKGVTSSGRPCRRALALSKLLRTGHRPFSVASDGIVAVVEEDGYLQETDFFCWQHKDQAAERLERVLEQGMQQPPRQRTDMYSLRERSSVETLVQRLGIAAKPERKSVQSSRHKHQQKTSTRTSAQDFARRSSSRSTPRQDKNFDQSPSPIKPSQSRKKVGFWDALCCMTTDDDHDYMEVVRHRQRIDAGRTRPKPATSAPAPDSASYGRQPSNTRTDAAQHSDPVDRPASLLQWSQHRRPSTTSQLLSLIPQQLSPQTTSALLSELVKPISPHDEEGYIYIFWLTSQDKEAPGEVKARSLLATPADRPPCARRISDVMTEYSFDGTVSDTKGRDVVMLKIGRANNVTRRMNEWKRQCGHELSLVRWYPHIPSSSRPSPQPSPDRDQSLYPDLSRPPMQGRRQSDIVRKVSCVKRVERLIHLELSDKQVRRQCDACGKEHREWFEVAASPAAVKAVDACVKRWVAWAENRMRGD